MAENNGNVGSAMAAAEAAGLSPLDVSYDRGTGTWVVGGRGSNMGATGANGGNFGGDSNEG